MSEVVVHLVTGGVLTLKADGWSVVPTTGIMLYVKNDGEQTNVAHFLPGSVAYLYKSANISPHQVPGRS